MICIIMKRLLTAKQTWYRKVYLLSEHWKSLRKAKIKINPSCEICGAKRRLDVHHIRYRNIYDVTVEDLQTLCRRCHKKHHRPKTKTRLVKDFIKRHKRHKWLV
jgi:5-methylcytosine-specific restriction endonuclease McrA